VFASSRNILQYDPRGKVPRLRLEFTEGDTQKGNTMFRWLSIALGVVLVVLGAESLAIDKAVLHKKKQPEQAESTFAFMTTEPAAKEIVVPEWAPWTMLSTGAIVLLYALAIPIHKAAAGGGGGDDDDH